jgi:hypothetical protein
VTLIQGESFAPRKASIAIHDQANMMRASTILDLVPQALFVNPVED